MRLTDLLQNDRVISKVQYEKLTTHGFKRLMCSRDGWDFSSVDDMTEDEARKWLYNSRLKRAYEKANRVKPLATVFIVHVIEHKEDEMPSWPDELQPYRDKVDNILEAYLCNKFNLPCENN